MPNPCRAEGESPTHEQRSLCSKNHSSCLPGEPFCWTGCQPLHPSPCRQRWPRGYDQHARSHFAHEPCHLSLCCLEPVRKPKLHNSAIHAHWHGRCLSPSSTVLAAFYGLGSTLHERPCSGPAGILDGAQPCLRHAFCCCCTSCTRVRKRPESWLWSAQFRAQLVWVSGVLISFAENRSPQRPGSNFASANKAAGGLNLVFHAEKFTVRNMPGRFWENLAMSWFCIPMLLETRYLATFDEMYDR